MQRVIIFGECMLELVQRDGNLLSRDYAGDTYNTAVYLKRCASHLSVSYFTAIGHDFLSDELLLNMGEEEINTDLVLRSRHGNLGLYMVRTKAVGERSFAYWRKHSAATDTINAFDGHFGPACLFYFSGISLAILDQEQRHRLLGLLKQVKKMGTSVAFDPNYRAALWPDKEETQYWMAQAYSIADIALPGIEDHQALYGHGDVESIYQYLSDLGVKEIVVKNGGSGVHVFHDGQHCIVPVERVNQVVDTTAAGDAFNGGYLASRLNDGTITEAASYGAKIAAIVIGHKGAIVNADQFRVEVPYFPRAKMCLG